MAKYQSVNYVRVAEVLVDLGMITQEKAQSVLDDFGDLAHEELKPHHHIAYALEDFAVAVSIHADDVDFADEEYASLLTEAAALTGGKVTVDNFRFDKDVPDDPDDGRGVLHFDRNGERLSFVIEQESNDYFDVGASREAIEALSPDDDPWSFRCVKHQPSPGTAEDVMVWATAEQREGLLRHLDIEFHEPF
ncbi:hypothetical protein ACGFOU_32060 [Streptomyces sp. NPDC048595]|uniref:hypothetical protein n=1 Tax=Streptomyces sp. NPDC048595 TaxID=3365576 RepID=UPI003720EE14